MTARISEGDENTVLGPALTGRPYPALRQVRRASAPRERRRWGGPARLRRKAASARSRRSAPDVTRAKADGANPPVKIRQRTVSKDTAEPEQAVVLFGGALHGAKRQATREPGYPGAVGGLTQGEEMAG